MNFAFVWFDLFTRSHHEQNAKRTVDARAYAVCFQRSRKTFRSEILVKWVVSAAFVRSREAYEAGELRQWNNKTEKYFQDKQQLSEQTLIK